MAEDERLGEIFDSYQKYSDVDVFDKFKRDFLRYSPEVRLEVLTAYDRKMEFETKPTRDHAELISRKRELDDLDRLLKKAGR